MIDRRWGWVVCALGYASVAHAEPGFLSRESGELRCEPFEDTARCFVGEDCGATAECRDFGAHGSFCAPANAIFCCTDDKGDCPTGSGTCEDISGLSGGSGLCLPDERYCGERSLEQVIACHTLPGTNVVTPAYRQGDCDRDGLGNADEVGLGTDECAAPAPIGVVGDGACVPLTVGCVVGVSCPVAPGGRVSTCETTPDGNGSYCNPGLDTLYCCDSQIVCPMSGDRCVDNLCVADDCEDFDDIDPAACVSDSEGNHVPYPSGDCDLDGIPNGGDETQCGVAFDAGVRPDFDAGSSDAGPTRGIIEPRFSGGGGCACRAGGPRDAPYALGLVILSAILRRRR
jgi:MYXO-CTERM domain-containing protein